MASVFELNFDNKHAVCESTMLKSTQIGTHFNVVNKTKDMDNGTVVKIDIEKHTEDDVFEAVVPTIKDKVALILTAEKIYETNYATQCSEPCYFYNKAGERMRAYEICEYDRFGLSKEGLAGTAAVGKYVVVDGTTHKLKIADANPNASTVTNAFVGKIIGQHTNGVYVVYVIRNTAV